MISQREAVIAEAVTWLRTPYHPRARVKGEGVDCLTFLVEVYERVLGIKIEVPHYSPQWHLHHSEELYVQGLLGAGCVEIETPQPADIAIFKFGRAYSHGGIVIEWPRIIHAAMEIRRVSYCDAERDGEVRNRPVRFFSPCR